MKKLNEQELKAFDFLLEQAALAFCIAKHYQDFAAQENAAETLRAANAIKGVA